MHAMSARPGLCFQGMPSACHHSSVACSSPSVSEGSSVVSGSSLTRLMVREPLRQPQFRQRDSRQEAHTLTEGLVRETMSQPSCAEPPPQGPTAIAVAPMTDGVVRPEAAAGEIQPRKVRGFRMSAGIRERWSSSVSCASCAVAPRTGGRPPQTRLHKVTRASPSTNSIPTSRA